MKSFKFCSRFSTAFLSMITALLLMVTAPAQAHTIQICWKDVGGVTTFYAGTYHYPTEAPSPVGGIIIDGFEFPFSGWIYPSALPVDAHCWSEPTYSSYYSPDVSALGNPDGTPHPGVVHYQTFTSGFESALHTISFTATNVVQSPIGTFAPQTFGGGACADADFDGICNDDDACPLDAANDGDGDGICGNVDNCPLDSNPDQSDANGNGQGDVCEAVVCGNGLIQGSEQCDDGNIAGGDGCSAICTIEILDSPPNADAGDDQAVDEEQLVTLDGTASNDPDGDPLTYSWVQLGGTGVSLSGGNTSQPTFLAPTVAPGGETLDFKLTVTANGLVDQDQVSINVVNVNHPPVAEAGVDQSIAEGSPASLDGTASFDIDSDLFSYSWSQESGPTVTLADSDTATPSFTAPTIDAGGSPGVVATLVFKLIVDDGFSADAPAPGYSLADVEDTVTVQVTNVNNDPVADAGTDKTLNENSAVQLNGSGSTDPDGDPLTYSWTQVDGTPVILSGELTATPSFTTPFVMPGGEDLSFQVTVDDGFGGTASDQIVAHVLNANDPPNADLAAPSVNCLWPPNHKLVEVSITGVSDPEDNATITIDSVTQDEPTNGLGDGDTATDAIINEDGTVLLRAERSGTGDGRIYHISFTASDLEGSDSGVVDVCVQHNKKKEAVDSGDSYDSTY